jgi:flagellar hook-length control protein FliK
MPTTFLNIVIPVASQATLISDSNKKTTTADLSTSGSFANILYGSVKANKSAASSSSATLSSDTNISKSDLQLAATDQNLIPTLPTVQTAATFNGEISTSPSVNESVVSDKKNQTTATAPLLDSTALLMMLLQTNMLAITPSAVTAQGSPQSAAADQSVQTVGATISTNANATNTQATVLQLAATQSKILTNAPTLTLTATSTADLATVLSALSDKSGSPTNDQLPAALKQLVENSSTKPIVPDQQAAGVVTDAITSEDAQSPSTVVTGSTVSKMTPLTQASQVAAAGEKITTIGDAAQQLPPVSLIANAATKLPQAVVPYDQQPAVNPVLAALQTQFTSKFTVDRQGSVLNAKAGVKAVNVAKTNSSPVTNPVDALSDNEAATITSPQEHNTLQFDTSQLFQPPSDGQSNNLSDTTLGSFAQALSIEQSPSSTVAVTESIPQQTTTSKDSFQIVEQIVDQVKLITRAQNTEMVIKLNPQHLGELTLKVTVDHGLVNATFHSNNSDVRSVIESSLPQLKQDLVNSGLKVDNVGVYTGLDQSTSNQQNQSRSQPQLKFVSKGSADNFDDIAQLAEENQLTATDGVDYRI